MRTVVSSRYLATSGIRSFALAPDLPHPAGDLRRRRPVWVVLFLKDAGALPQNQQQLFTARLLPDRLRDEGAAPSLPYQPVHLFDPVGGAVDIVANTIDFSGLQSSATGDAVT